MKSRVLAFLLFLHFSSTAQQAQNIVIVTTDGFRWQEIFKGADSVLINDPRVVRDTALIKQMYWDPDPVLRRRKLMPFFWTVIASRGQIYGNRLLNNKMDVKNLFKISYPGYNELFTGFADPLFIPNLPIPDRNLNVLEYLDKCDEYRGRVAVFCSWDLIPYVLNRKRNGLSVNAQTDSLICQMEASVRPRGSTGDDRLTFLNAQHYMEVCHPRVVYISFGQTDEFAHEGRYDLYLQQAADLDRMIADLWYTVQTDPFYRDHTTFIFTTDHGRGDKPRTWHTHNMLTRGSGEIWLALLGQGVAPLGEMTEGEQLFQGQLAATIAGLTGHVFTADHPIASPIVLPPVPVPWSGSPTLAGPYKIK